MNFADVLQSNCYHLRSYVFWQIGDGHRFSNGDESPKKWWRITVFFRDKWWPSPFFSEITEYLSCIYLSCVYHVSIIHASSSGVKHFRVWSKAPAGHKSYTLRWPGEGNNVSREFARGFEVLCDPKRSPGERFRSPLVLVAPCEEIMMPTANHQRFWDVVRPKPLSWRAISIATGSSC